MRRGRKEESKGGVEEGRGRERILHTQGLGNKVVIVVGSGWLGEVLKRAVLLENLPEPEDEMAGPSSFLEPN